MTKILDYTNNNENVYKKPKPIEAIFYVTNEKIYRDDVNVKGYDFIALLNKGVNGSYDVFKAWNSTNEKEDEIDVIYFGWWNDGFVGENK